MLSILISKWKARLSPAAFMSGLSILLMIGLIILFSSLSFRQAACAEWQADVPGQFRLLSGGGKFHLEVTTGKRTLKIPLNRKWLIPAEEEKEDEENYVNAFKYGKDITAFSVGNGKFGLHLSSYDIQEEGSAQAAAGKDVFLLYDLSSCRVKDGLISLGITKSRFRHEGCFQAEHSIFVIADVNGDGAMDIGVIKEEILCNFDPARDSAPGPPYFVQKPIKWYVYKKEKWQYDRAYDGIWVKDYRELPLIGMGTSPIDFVAHGLWNSYNPSRWKTINGKTPGYIPGYRKALIENK